MLFGKQFIKVIQHLSMFIYIDVAIYDKKQEFKIYSKYESKNLDILFICSN